MTNDCLVLIVEDELLIADHISRVLKSAGFPNNRYVTNVEDAIAVIEQDSPAIVLTDITLSGAKNGIDLGELLYSKYRLPFIYITSHAGVEMAGKVKFTRPNAYLVKPFKKEDLVIAMELALMKEPEEQEQFFMIKDGHSVAQVSYDDILWLEADGNYTLLVTTGSSKKRILRNVLTELHKQLPEADFIRIHRSFVINRKKIAEYSSGHVIINDMKLPVGRTYRDNLK